MAKKAFPPGRPLPEPYTVTLWATTDANDSRIDRLPFIMATCKISRDGLYNSPSTEFIHTPCLWDTGAQTCVVLTSRLNHQVTQGQNEGFAVMDIW